MAPTSSFFTRQTSRMAKQHKAAFQAAVCKLGAVEICVNNVGILNEKNWEKVLPINVESHIRGSLLALEHMRRDYGGRGGVIINVASTLGYLSMPTSPIYVASKHAVVGFTTSWAMSPDQKEHGVRWCCLCPDAFDSEMMRESLKGDIIHNAEVLQHYVQQQGTLKISQVAEGVS
ncbi:15-hydroxyprostaglandin dehydrogenase [NAD(+)]-like isoform X2 [Pomacea canaliculata]|uniref:15-hydroxyprostaglandin dehydrogenase [NAD(+)]-like isoform X2 n=1 Tax=Pomacea canaliculata TaxID=400727 RepID=UPI000D735536|nr:15-hydroxyprostaglandin dehydrogenase [NAD(+)]-like isoform X2 [Pomacea canaliculata]